MMRSHFNFWMLNFWMRSRLRSLVVLCLIPAFCFAQSTAAQDSDAAQGDAAQAAPAYSDQSAPVAAAPLPVKHSPQGYPILQDGTPIRLSLARTLSSADSRPGDRVDFKVVEPIVLDGMTVVPQGGIAWGKVVDVQRKRRMGRGGRLGIAVDSVEMANTQKAMLRATRESQGGGHQGIMGGAMVGTAIVFLPAAPLFLLMHGKEAKIREGTEITAYVNGDTIFVPPEGAAPANAAPPQAAAPAAPTAEAPGQPAPQSQSSTEAGAPEAGTAEGAPQGATDEAAPPEAAPNETDMPEAAAPENSAESAASDDSDNSGAAQAEPLSTEISFTSSPDGADIELDGAYIGSTPSTLGVPGGDHTVRFSKRGYQPYERKVRTAGGSISVHADLLPIGQ